MFDKYPKKRFKTVLKGNRVSDIVIISTGGTFNKVYNPINGNLEIDKSSASVDKISQKWQCKFELINIIGKDSLDMSDSDRELLVHTIKSQASKKIVIIHGTDTISESAEVIDRFVKNKIVVLTGAMVPFAIDEVEAVANFAMSVGFLEANPQSGVYIAMHSIVREWSKILKDRELGVFREI